MGTPECARAEDMWSWIQAVLTCQDAYGDPGGWCFQSSLELTTAIWFSCSRRHCSTLSAITCRAVTLSWKMVIFPGKSQAPYFVLCETTDHPTVLFHQTRKVGVFGLNEQRSQDQGKLLQRNVLLKRINSVSSRKDMPELLIPISPKDYLF